MSKEYELDRIREMVLLVPTTNHETHFALNNAISAIWNLRDTLRHLLLLHREGQHAFRQKAEAQQTLKKPNAQRSAKSSPNKTPHFISRHGRKRSRSAAR